MENYQLLEKQVQDLQVLLDVSSWQAFWNLVKSYLRMAIKWGNITKALESFSELPPTKRVEQLNDILSLLAAFGWVEKIGEIREAVGAKVVDWEEWEREAAAVGFGIFWCEKKSGWLGELFEVLLEDTGSELSPGLGAAWNGILLGWNRPGKFDEVLAEALSTYLQSKGISDQFFQEVLNSLESGNKILVPKLPFTPWEALAMEGSNRPALFKNALYPPWLGPALMGLAVASLSLSLDRMKKELGTVLQWTVLKKPSLWKGGSEEMERLKELFTSLHTAAVKRSLRFHVRAALR